MFDLSDGASGADGGANLGELWVAACVEARGLPVVFQYVSDQALENAIYDIVPVADAFYIGATTDPRRAGSVETACEATCKATPRYGTNYTSFICPTRRVLAVRKRA